MATGTFFYLSPVAFTLFPHPNNILSGNILICSFSVWEGKIKTLSRHLTCHPENPDRIFMKFASLGECRPLGCTPNMMLIKTSLGRFSSAFSQILLCNLKWKV